MDLVAKVFIGPNVIRIPTTSFDGLVRDVRVYVEGTLGVAAHYDLFCDDLGCTGDQTRSRRRLTASTWRGVVDDALSKRGSGGQLAGPAVVKVHVINHVDQAIECLDDTKVASMSSPLVSSAPSTPSGEWMVVDIPSEKSSQEYDEEKTPKSSTNHSVDAAIAPAASLSASSTLHTALLERTPADMGNEQLALGPHDTDMPAIAQETVSDAHLALEMWREELAQTETCDATVARALQEEAREASVPGEPVASAGMGRPNVASVNTASPTIYNPMRTQRSSVSRWVMQAREGQRAMNSSVAAMRQERAAAWRSQCTASQAAGFSHGGASVGHSFAGHSWGGRGRGEGGYHGFNGGANSSMAELRVMRGVFHTGAFCLRNDRVRLVDAMITGPVKISNSEVICDTCQITGCVTLENSTLVFNSGTFTGCLYQDAASTYRCFGSHCGIVSRY